MSDNDSETDELAQKEAGEYIVETCEEAVDAWVRSEKPVRRVEGQIIADEEWIVENLAIIVALTADGFNS